jgi:hypothetical protein
MVKDPGMLHLREAALSKGFTGRRLKEPATTLQARKSGIQHSDQALRLSAPRRTSRWNIEPSCMQGSVRGLSFRGLGQVICAHSRR